MTRYEVPAIIIVDAESATDADNKAMELGATIGRPEGPGAFFHRVGVAITGQPRECEDDRQVEELEEHAESLQAASGH